MLDDVAIWLPPRLTIYPVAPLEGFQARLIWLVPAVLAVKFCGVGGAPGMFCERISAL